MPTRLSRAVLGVSLLASGLVGLLPSPALGAVIRVTTTGDQLDVPANTHCSLREAIRSAQTDTAVGGCAAGASGGDVIILESLTYVLNRAGPSEQESLTGDLDLEGTVTIKGAGARRTRILGGASFGDRVFEVEPGAVVDLSALTVADGDSADGFGGGGIYNTGTLTLTGVALSGNASNGGAGGIRNAGTATLTMRDTAVTGNTAFSSGGGISNEGTMSLTNVTLSGNGAGLDGGGMNMASGTASLDHVTVTKNTADADESGGGSGGGGIAGAGVTLTRSILAGNRVGTTPGDDCLGDAASGGSNVVGETSCLTSIAAGDIQAAPGLLGLANNGGPTDTHALVATSPANGRVASGCATQDQRGVPRSTPCDAGAYELVLCLGVPVNRVGTDASERLLGTPGADSILGLGGNDELEGFGGADRLCGGNGRDKLKGNAGNDLLSGGGGGDALIGGSGRDRLGGGSGADRLNGGGSPDRCRGGPGRDTLIACER